MRPVPTLLRDFFRMAFILRFHREARRDSGGILFLAENQRFVSAMSDECARVQPWGAAGVCLTKKCRVRQSSMKSLEGVLAMPIYEYECTQCGKRKEVWQKISDKPLTLCDSCKGRLRKLISQSTFHLKGSGWYVTDYASKSSNCTQSASTGATSSSTVGAEGTGQSKPAQSCESTNAGGTAKDCSPAS